MDYSNEEPGFLFEPQETQLFQYSNKITSFSGVVNENYEQSPIKDINSIQLKKTSDSVQYANIFWLNGQLESEKKYIIDFYVKYDGTNINFRIEHNTSTDFDKAFYAPFSVTSDGVIPNGSPTNCTTGVVKSEKGYYRCYCIVETGTNPVFTSGSILIRIDGNTDDSLVISQLNMKRRGFLTSTIESDNTLFTRSKDVLKITNLDLKGIGQQSNWTIKFKKLKTSDEISLDGDDAVIQIKNNNSLVLSIERYRNNYLRSYNYLDSAYMLGAGNLGGIYSDGFDFAITKSNNEFIFYRNKIEVDRYTATNNLMFDEIVIQTSRSQCIISNLVIIEKALLPSEL